MGPDFDHLHAAVMTDAGSGTAVAPRHLVITVHGIRTFGNWQERLETLLRTAEHGRGSQVTVVNYKYGYFSVAAFLSVILRWLTVRRFRRQLLTLAASGWNRIDIVAHSFGTHLVGRALYSLRKSGCPHIDTVILAGSVLPSQFDWNALVPGHVGRVINECGTRDHFLLLSQAVPLLGMAGRAGFFGMTGATLRNRFFDLGHSGYFKEGRANTDAFMRERWVPLLLETDAIAPFDARPAGHFAVVEGFLLNNARPLKVVAYVVLLGLLFGYGVPWASEAYAVNLVSRENGYVSNEKGGLTVRYDAGASPKRSLRWLDAVGTVQQLDLESTNIQDADLDTLPTIETLAVLKLGNTQVTSRSLPSLSRFQALRELTLYDLELGTLDGFPDWPQLQMLDLDGNDLDDAALAHLSPLSDLRELLLEGNRITGSGLAHLAGLTRLRRLTLVDNALDDAGLSKVPALPELRVLNVSENPGVRGEAFAAMAGLKSLDQLWAKDTGVDAAFLAHFPVLPSLRLLSLPGTRLGGGQLSFLKNVPGLQTLYVGGTGLADDDLRGLEHLTELRTLYIPTNPDVTDLAVQRLIGIRALRELNIDFTGVSTNGRAEIRRTRRDIKLVSLD